MNKSATAGGIWGRFSDWLLPASQRGKILRNVSWLFFDKFFSLAIGILTNLIVARYLGASEFGVLCFAMSISTMTAVFSTLAMDEILVRDLVRSPEDKDELLGTALMLRLCGSGLAILATFAFVIATRPLDDVSSIVVLIVSVSHIPNAASVVAKLNTAQLDSKYNVIGANLSLTLITFAKLLFVFKGCSVYWFACANVLLVVLNFGSVMALHLRRGGRLNTWKLNSDCAIRLLRDLCPRLPTVLAATSQIHIGALVLAEYLGLARMGEFAVALRFYMLANILPGILSQSLAPVLIAAHQKDKRSFLVSLGKAYRAVLFLYASALVGIGAFSLWGIRVLYGDQYPTSGTSLALLSVPMLFTFLGQVRLWFISINNLFSYSMYLAFAQLPISYGLSLALVPSFAELGAVVAMTLSAGLPFLVDIFFRESRGNHTAILVGLGKKA